LIFFYTFQQQGALQLITVIHRVSIGLVENYGHFTGAWREAAEVVSSMTPNSASVERVFTLLTCMFRDKQEKLPRRLAQSSIMLRCKKRKSR
jgi:hypothetical protein